MKTTLIKDFTRVVKILNHLKFYAGNLFQCLICVDKEHWQITSLKLPFGPLRLVGIIILFASNNLAIDYIVYKKVNNV